MMQAARARTAPTAAQLQRAVQVQADAEAAYERKTTILNGGAHQGAASMFGAAARCTGRPCSRTSHR